MSPTPRLRSYKVIMGRGVRAPCTASQCRVPTYTHLFNFSRVSVRPQSWLSRQTWRQVLLRDLTVTVTVRVTMDATMTIIQKIFSTKNGKWVLLYLLPIPIPIPIPIQFYLVLYQSGGCGCGCAGVKKNGPEVAGCTVAPAEEEEVARTWSRGQGTEDRTREV